jgi:phage gp29-like protein
MKAVDKNRKDPQGWAPKVDVKESDHTLFEGRHFATRERLNDFVRLMRTLPDADPILRKMGKGIPALRELLTNSHLESVWTVRCSTTVGAEYFVGAGGDGKKEQEAAESFGEELKYLDIPHIIEEMMDAVAYGYAPLEILWEARDGRWSIGNIVGKSPEWFEFNQDNQLVFRTGSIGQEALPENRFLVVQHRASYANPYGTKVFSKCFWPATFKRSGWQWWTVFIEKYGGALMYGEYPDNASEQFQTDLFAALKSMIANSVAIIPEGSKITITSASDKSGSSNVHKEYIAMANAEISKAILGQTLTTEIGDKGSYAAAKAHNLVREDLAKADRQRVCAAFNHLAAIYTRYNFGPDVVPPRFEFIKDEDLQKDRAERDRILYAIGVQPKKGYISREYSIPEEEFDLIHDKGNKPAGFSVGNTSVCSCGQQGSLINRFASLFAKNTKDERLMQEFSGELLSDGQDELDRTIESYVDALGKVSNYKDAQKALAEVYQNRTVEPFTHLINEVRFAAQGIGGRHHG